MSSMRVLTATASQETDLPAAHLPHPGERQQDLRPHRPGRTTARLLLACGALLGAMAATVPAPVSAGSFRIYDHSASATGQASAFAAQADDASAGYYNPAGMTQLRGVQLSAGTTLIAGGFSFQNAAGTHANGDLRGSVAIPPPSNLYITANLKDLGIGSL